MEPHAAPGLGVQVALASVTYGPANRIVGPVASATGPRGPRVREELAKLPTRASLLCALRESSQKEKALRKGRWPQSQEHSLWSSRRVRHALIRQTHIGRAPLRRRIECCWRRLKKCVTVYLIMVQYGFFGEDAFEPIAVSSGGPRPRFCFGCRLYRQEVRRRRKRQP